MTRKRPVILSIAAALAALPGVGAQVDEATAKVPSGHSFEAERVTSAARPNVFYNVGEDVMGLVVTQQADGTIVAQHYSHSSHSSHSSHRSHYSSRY